MKLKEKLKEWQLENQIIISIATDGLNYKDNKIIAFAGALSNKDWELVNLYIQGGNVQATQAITNISPIIYKEQAQPLEKAKTTIIELMTDKLIILFNQEFVCKFLDQLGAKYNTEKIVDLSVLGAIYHTIGEIPDEVVNADSFEKYNEVIKKYKQYMRKIKLETIYENLRLPDIKEPVIHIKKCKQLINLWEFLLAS